MAGAPATNQLCGPSALLLFEWSGAFRVLLEGHRTPVRLLQKISSCNLILFRERPLTNFFRQILICHVASRRDVDTGDLRKRGNVLAFLHVCVGEFAVGGCGLSS